MAGHGYLRLSLLYMVGLLAFSHVIYGEEYLLSFVKNAFPTASSVSVQTGESGNWLEIKNILRRGTLLPYASYGFVVNESMVTTNGIESKYVIVNVSDHGVSVYGTYVHSVFSPLPISALGTKYIVSSCHPPGNYTLVLMIATHRQKTDVEITFRLEGNVSYDGGTYSNGDTLTLSLEEYQTFTIKSDFDLTGTVVNTKQTVAVFSVTMLNGSVSASSQLLPLQHYGQEIIVATDDKNIYQFQVVSDHSDTEITFINGTTVSVGDRGIYRQSLAQNASLYFSSSRPVMTTLCKLTGSSLRRIGFAVVPPVRLYTKQTSFQSFGLFKVLAHRDATINVTRGNSSTHIQGSPTYIQGQWEDIPGTRYKVGTVDDFNNVISITSKTSFTVLNLSFYCIRNGGYHFPITTTRKNEL